jgi:hypothetical protein
MTEPKPGELSPDKVAELQQQLAAASAEVAKVQAELQAAGSAAPIVPYGGQTSSTVTLQGQQVLVNGEPVAPGQTVDLSTFLSPEVAEQVRASLDQLGVSGRLGGLFGPTAGAPTVPPESVRLADPPRRVPFAFRLATFSWSWWETFALLMAVVAPIAVWAFLPQLVPAGLIAAVLVIGYLRLRKYVIRVGVLKWGKVATVTNAEELSRGTYYSGTTYQNMRVRQAHGWDVVTSWYSGPASKTQLKYTLDGTNASLTLRGLPYAGGVVLADSRKPTRAVCVSQFPYSVKPDVDGQLVARLTPWLWGGTIATLLVEGTLVYVTVVAVLRIWLDR